MKLLPMNYQFKRYPLTMFLDKVQETELNEIELYCSAPQFDVFTYSLKELSNIKQELKKRKITVGVLTPENFAYPVNFSIPNNDILHSSLCYYQKAIDAASFLGCEKVQISVGTGYFNEPKEKAWQICRENLTLLCQYCKHLGITLVLEELKQDNSNVINTSVELVKMISEVDSPNLVGMLDIDQMVVNGEEPSDYFQNLGKKLIHLHFNDTGHTVPGDGDYPMPEFYDEIVASGYNGTCSFEICDARYFCDPKLSIDRIIGWFKDNTKEI